VTLPAAILRHGSTSGICMVISPTRHSVEATSPQGMDAKAKQMQAF
jgi:hypothetical protein